MSSRRTGVTGLLRWYPPAWRERYGDELVALMEDDLGGRRPTVGFRLSVAVGGVRERAHGAGLLGDTLPRAERARSASLLVLCAWTVFVLAGASFSKLSEHFDGAVPTASRSLPTRAFDSVVVAAAVGGVLVVAGALVAVPAFARFLRHGGWAAVRRQVIRAATVTAVTVGVTCALVPWAHSLTPTQRNGGSVPYGLAFLAWAALVAMTLILWTAVAVAAGRRVELSDRALALESALATVVAAAMVAMTVATAVWWGALATRAPWFLHGAPAGSGGSSFDPRLALTTGVMLVAASTGVYGAVRIGRSRARVRPG
jgi:hypothetical protein